MSYDILVFDPAAVSDADFSAWREEQSAWPEDHSYSDPAVTTSELRAFYADMCRQFPDMDALTAEELDAGPGLDVVCQDI